MAEQELVSLEELVKQWDEEMPLLTVDTVVRQLLRYVQEGEVERGKLMQRVDKQTIDIAELRARLKHLQKGGGVDVHV